MTFLVLLLVVGVVGIGVLLVGVLYLLDDDLREQRRAFQLLADLRAHATATDMRIKRAEQALAENLHRAEFDWPED